MQKNCKDMELDLTEYTSGHYEDVKDYNGLIEHLKECVTCRKRLNELKEVIGVLCQDKKPPEEFQRKMDELLKELETIPEATEPMDVTPLIEQGKDYMKIGEYPDAIEHFNKALLLDSQSAPALIYKGVALAHLGGWQKALELYDEALKFNMGNIDKKEALMNKGIALVKLDRSQEALGALNAGLDIQPLCQEGNYYKGVALRKLGKDKDALQSLNKALEIEKGNTHLRVRILSNKGIVLVNLSEPDEALKSLGEALNINPNDVRTLVTKAVILSITGQNKPAFEILKKASELEPSNVRVWYNLGYITRKSEEIPSKEDSISKLSDVIDRTTEAVSESTQKILEEIKLTADEERKRLNNIANNLRKQIEEATQTLKKESPVKSTTE